MFQEVDETLKQKLSKLMFEGPVEELILTENTQPALMAHSLAVLRVLEREGGTTLQRKALVVAGHSLGEYTALGRCWGVHHQGRGGAAAETTGPGDAKGGAGRYGSNGRSVGRRHGTGCGDLPLKPHVVPETEKFGDCPTGQRQRRRPSGDLRPSYCD